jgi:hypothetical protein
LDFNSDAKFSSSITRALQTQIKLKNALQLAINAICDLTKTRFTICEWEKEICDNQQLLNPKFV